MSKGADGVPGWLGRLTPAEERVWRAFPRGELVDLRTGDAALDDPARAADWPEERVVRAPVLAALLLGASPQAPGRIAKLGLTGARITGLLTVENGRLVAVCSLLYCAFDAPIVFDEAETRAIDLRCSRIPAISAYGARVNGRLDLRDVVVVGGHPHALHADGVVIDSDLFAGGLRVTGRCSLVNAEVGGQVTLNGARFNNPGATALSAGGLHVGRSLEARRLHAAGELRLPGARIDSGVILDEAVLDGGDEPALSAESIVVASDFFARSITTRGEIRLLGARIGGGLHFTGASLEPTSSRPVLNATRMTVGGSCYLTNGFRTSGEIRLTNARVEGHLDIERMNSPEALLVLFATRVGSVHEDPRAWPGRLNLDGFGYGDISPYRPARERVHLLRRQVGNDHRPGDYRAQPYEQLAAMYRGYGNDGEARTVLLAKAHARQRVLPWTNRISNSVLDVAVGYGYRPLRAVGWIVGLLLFGSVFFSYDRPTHVMRDDESVYNPLLYTTDQLVPLVHFGQQEAYQSHGAAAVVAALLGVIGWALGIAVVAAATRVLTRD